MDVTSAPLSAALMPVTPSVLHVDVSCALHPLFVHKLDSGPIRLMTIAHAFNYRVAVLRDGVWSAIRIGRSGDGTGKVAGFAVQRQSCGCGHSVTSGCMPDDHEPRHSGPICTIATWCGLMLETSIGTSDYPADVVGGALGL